MRLDAYIASFGGMSRREAGMAIRQRRAAVDGMPQGDASFHVVPGASRVRCDGTELIWEDAFYLMMHKAEGVLSATSDPKALTVLDALEPRHRARGVFPVGRLDRDATGLLLLTDDGVLAHRLLSPSRMVEKVYEVRLDAPPSADAVERFARGLALGDFTALPARLELIPPVCARVTVCEGKFHQVKRMFEAVGSGVLALKRLSMGGLSLDASLTPGAWRPLTRGELDALRKAATPDG